MDTAVIQLGGAALLVITGAAAMFCSARSGLRLLKGSLPELGTGTPEAPVVKPLLLNPVSEVLLGILFTVSTPFFTLWCVIGSGKMTAAFLVALFTAVLTSFGTYVRRRDALNELGVVREKRRIHHQLICFSIALLLFLLGLVFLAEAGYARFRSAAPAPVATIIPES